MMKYFPLSEAGQKSLTHLIVSIVFYLIAIWVANLIGGLTGWVLLLGTIVRIVVWLFDLYCVAGIVVAVLKWFKIIK